MLMSHLGVLFFPTVAIAYVMIDYPQSAFPFLLLNYWMTSMASEAMLSFICKVNLLHTCVAIMDIPI